MRAKDIMTTPVITVTRDTPIKRVAALLVERKIGAVPVVDKADELVGIVSETDLVPLESTPDTRSRITARKWRRYRVPRTAAEVMMRDVAVLPEDADVAEVARLMLEHRVRHLPIVSERHVVGIVSRRDILKVLARTDAEIARDLDRVLRDDIVARGQYRASVIDGVVTLTGPADPENRRFAELLARTIPGVIEVSFSEEP